MPPFEGLGIGPGARAETLTLDQFVALAAIARQEAKLDGKGGTLHYLRIVHRCVYTGDLAPSNEHGMAMRCWGYPGVL